MTFVDFWFSLFWHFGLFGGHWEEMAQLNNRDKHWCFSIDKSIKLPKHYPDIPRHHPDAPRCTPDTLWTHSGHCLFTQLAPIESSGQKYYRVKWQLLNLFKWANFWLGISLPSYIWGFTWLLSCSSPLPGLHTESAYFMTKQILRQNSVNSIKKDLTAKQCELLYQSTCHTTAISCETAHWIQKFLHIHI